MIFIGKVLKVLKPDSKDVESFDKTVQVFCHMFDGNSVFLDVQPSLSDKVKPGDFVLARYPYQNEPFIIKILKGKSGSELFNKMSDSLKKKREQQQAQKRAAAPVMDFQNPMIR